MISTGLRLQTPQVLLRPMQVSDLEALLDLTRDDEEAWLYFTVNLSHRSTLEKWMQAAAREREAATRIPFTIIHTATGHVAGSTSMGNISPQDLRMEIGWSWLGKAFRGTGINRHCKYAMMRHAFENMMFERVEFKTDVLNERARRGLRGIGATEEGILRSHMAMWNNRRRDSVYFSVLKTEWPAVKAGLFKDITNEMD